MYLLKEKIFPAVINKEEMLSIKQLYGIRRMPDYFLALLDAMHKTDLSDEEKDGLGIIYASHLGPLKQVHKYVEDLLTFPPEECSPAYFSHSVFNAPIAFLTKFLNINSASLSVCGFRQIIESSVMTAYSWLKTSYCRKVIIIYSDDISDISHTISNLTGLQIFKNINVILLSNDAPDENSADLTYDQIIEHIKQNICEGA